MMRLAIVVACLASVACGDDGPIAKYNVPTSGPIDWGLAPFPNDLYLGEDGTVDIASMPSDAPVWESVRTYVNGRRGFCSTCTIHFPISGAVNPATLASGALLIDDAGFKVDVDVEWDEANSMIAMRPKRGRVLEAGKKYTAGLTNAIRDNDGNALRAADGFNSARARTITAAAVEDLKDAGANGTVVSATTFTVEDPTLLAKDIAAMVTAYYATSAPVVTVERVWKATDGTLEDLMGTPAQNLPGFDNPAMTGTIGKFAVTHQNVSIVIKGTYSSVRVISGTGMELGTVQPTAVAGDAVPFLLAIPIGVDVTNLPVVVFGHGAGGKLPESLALADVAARAHAAVIAHETFQHGERSTTAVDQEHSLRGDPGSLGPDGFFEHTVTSVAFRLFAVDGPPADQKASPLYIAGSLAQMTADVHALLTVVAKSNLAPIAATDASLTGLAFDQTHIFYFGVSMGTVYGSMMLAGDTRVSAAVLNVPPGSIVECLLENETFRTQVELAMLDPLGIPNDDYEPDRHLMMNPSISFFEWALNGTESIALARHNFERTDRDWLIQIAGLDELAGTPSGEGFVAAAGIPGVGTFDHASVMPGTAPIQGRAAWVYPQADHFMVGNMKGSSANEVPALPPFQRRASPLMFTNPIVDAHIQLTHFYETRRTTGTAEIR